MTLNSFHQRLLKFACFPDALVLICFIGLAPNRNFSIIFLSVGLSFAFLNVNLYPFGRFFLQFGRNLLFHIFIAFCFEFSFLTLCLPYVFHFFQLSHFVYTKFCLYKILDPADREQPTSFSTQVKVIFLKEVYNPSHC